MSGCQKPVVVVLRREAAVVVVLRREAATPCPSAPLLPPASDRRLGSRRHRRGRRRCEPSSLMRIVDVSSMTDSATCRSHRVA
jgi:hypothetical protein